MSDAVSRSESHRWRKLPNVAIVAFAILFCDTISVADASKPTSDLQQLRAAYSQAVAEAAKIPRPKRDDPDFRNKLGTWSNVNMERTRAIHELVPALLEAWRQLPDDSPQFAELKEEIRAVHEEALKPPRSEKSHNESQFFADVIWDYVAAPGIAKSRADFLAEFTVPHAGIRVNDKLAMLGLPTEPYGWDIQMTHAMALARAGETEDARTESEALLNKLNANLTRGGVPNIKVNFRGSKRSQQSLKRESLLQRSLIEALAGKKDLAKSLLKQARDIDEADTVLATQKNLVQEIVALTDQ